MAFSISAVVLLAIIVVLLVRKSGLKGVHALVCVLFGFFLASSSVAPTINEVTSNVAGMISGLSF
ncbi:membrane protein [Streptomyces sodiiphilus]|uniref:Membrane protein n=1 Tax=Streptomyces sodiiphilus TaxID=226217 RepID=A0ABN2NVY8_9ACTN